MSPITLRVRELRLAKGFASQQALADKAGVRVKTISDLERRTPQRIHLEAIEKIAKALGVRPLDLLDESSPRRRAKGAA